MDCRNKPDFYECAAQFMETIGDQTESPSSRLADLLEEMYTRGVSDGRDSLTKTPDRHCCCPNCDWLGPESQLSCYLEDIADLASRLEPGSEVPVGECPECGALAYLTEKGDYLKIDADWLQEHVTTVLASKYGDGTSECRNYVFGLLCREDPHTAVASFMFKKVHDSVTKAERDQAKTELYQLVYGGS